MRHTDLVADLPELPQGGGSLVELLPRLEADGVDNEVCMDVFRVAVGGHLDLISRPRLCRELQTNGVGLLVGDLLLGRKGLDVLVEIDPIQLVPGGLGGEKFRAGVGAVTVQTADITPPVFWIGGLVLPLAVTDHRPHGADVLLRFLDVGYGRQGFPPMAVRAS